MILQTKLKNLWSGIDYPFFKDVNGKEFFYENLENIEIEGIDLINEGDVVAIIGDFNPETIYTLLCLIERKAIVVPISEETKEQHNYFLNESYSQYLFKENKLIKKISPIQLVHPLIDKLRKSGNPGLIFFTTGTTGRPKAILHNFHPFIERYKTPRPSLKAVSFLLFDHIGGLNTLLHMLFNRGQVVALKERNINSVINVINKYSIELLPTTPTFLRMLSLYEGIEKKISSSLKIISYGTERMDQPTLDRLCKQFPNVDFRQTYGMSELGILRIKSQSRNSLYMKVGGEGIETKIKDGILFIRSRNRMVGYLNAKNPFDKEDWYCTNDIVEEIENGYIKIIGRKTDVINIGGLKFMPSEVELECLKNPLVKQVKAVGRNNPITGQHLEIIVETDTNNDSKKLKENILNNLKKNLPKHMIPSKIIFESLKVSHRFKKS